MEKIELLKIIYSIFNLKRFKINNIGKMNQAYVIILLS